MREFRMYEFSEWIFEHFIYSTIIHNIYRLIFFFRLSGPIYLIPEYSFVVFILTCFRFLVLRFFFINQTAFFYSKKHILLKINSSFQ